MGRPQETDWHILFIVTLPLRCFPQSRTSAERTDEAGFTRKLIFNVNLWSRPPRRPSRPRLRLEIQRASTSRLSSFPHSTPIYSCSAKQQWQTIPGKQVQALVPQGPRQRQSKDSRRTSFSGKMANPAKHATPSET